MLKDHPVVYGVDSRSGDAGYWQREQERSMSFYRSFRRTGYSITPSISFRHQRLTSLSNITDGIYNPYWTGNLCDINPAVSFINYRIHRNSISPSGGRRLHAQAGFYNKRWGSDIDQTYLFGLWDEYLGLPFDRQVLNVRIRADAYYAQDRAYLETIDWFTLRGYDQYETSGPRRLAATLEYRFPLFDIQRGISTWPVYFKNVHAAAFWEGGAGAYSFDDLRTKPFKQSLGAELTADWTFFYSLPSSFKIGLARTLQRPSKLSLYLTFTQDILGI